MFLSRGGLPHAEMWKDWLGFVNGYVPVHLLQAANCSQELTERLTKVCGPAQGPDVISQQHLFSVYVHAPPNIPTMSVSGQVLLGGCHPRHMALVQLICACALSMNACLTV